ncbi:hypothetical protein C8J57DRAFT_1273353 [Mycena rebaudengoi]|nr:hypothetical protein C8J57DRAFT_1273353 [Mycena rebaudengoi]
MPVSFSVANHSAKPVALWSPQFRDGLTEQEILSSACADQFSKAAKIMQSSFNGDSKETSTSMLIPGQNGFVDTVIMAYTQHHALVLRPDDVWMMILLQFNFFVNANADLLRASFVAHDDKEELIVATLGPPDFGAMARQMTDLIEKIAILMMATLKEYFTYTMMFGCGIPRVTLEGERSDWVNILQRLEKLKEYGIETIAWYHLLRPVISRFVSAFDFPQNPENVDFWQRVAKHQSGGSGGPSFYSGWITAFYVFDKKGKWIGTPLNTEVASMEAPESLGAQRFWALYEKPAAPVQQPFSSRWGPPAPVERLVLDDTPFHRVNGSDMPPGCAEVDVKVVGGPGGDKTCVMTAGLVGTRVTSSEDTNLSSTGTDDTVRPVAGWWMFETKTPV